MFKVIKPGVEFSHLIKYILIDKNEMRCIIILTVDEADNSNLEKPLNFLENELDGFDITVKNCLSPESELTFIWPQIVHELKDQYPYINGWLERARLNIKGDIVFLYTETEVAYKNLNNDRIGSFIKKRLQELINTDLELKVKNGNFLPEISNSVDIARYKQRKNRENKSNKKNITVDNTNRAKRKETKSNIVYGKKITGEITHKLNEIESEIDNIIIEALIFEVEEINTRRGNTFYVLGVTDNSNSITVKIFPRRDNDLNCELKEGSRARFKGYVQYDKYSKELVLMADAINTIKKEERLDEEEEKRVELHLHTQMSAMDSVVDVEKAIARAAKWGHQAIAITDHGVVQAFPDAYQAGKKHGVKILYGMEAYMIDDGELIVFNNGKDLLKSAKFTVFDFETTGLNNRRDEIIEIGAVRVEDGEIVEKYGSFVKPEQGIPASITELTGINNRMVADAPGIEDVIDEFLNFIGDSVLVAHNAPFDFGFLRAAVRKTKREKIDNTILDTLGLSRALLPDLKNHKLNTLSKFMEITLKNHHRAVDDARATAYILDSLLKRLSKMEIDTFDDINKLTTRIDLKNLPSYHLVILARNKAGLKDLYKLVSSSHLKHFYRKPRILKSELTSIRDNLIIGSACEAGQLFRSILENQDWSDIFKLARFYDFLEIQPLGNNNFMLGNQLESNEDLIKINKKIYKMGKKLNKPVVATCDVHFLDPEDEVYRKILQAGQGYEKAEEQAPLYFRTTKEMIDEFSYLGEDVAREVVITNSQKIAEEIEELKPMPDGLFTPEIDGADEKIRKMSYTKAREMYGEELPKLIEDRLEKELDSIISNGFSVIYLISHKLVKKSLNDGYLVGSRGSVGSSLVATMCEITEVNPLPPHYRCPHCSFVEFVEDSKIGIGVDLKDKKCPDCDHQLIKDGFDIPFEVFMGFEGDKVPDIDLNFSGEYQGKIHRYTEELFGRDYVFRAGTISTIAKRTAFGFVKGYEEDTGKILNNAETKRLAQGCTGVRRTTGQHPGGLMVVPRHLDIHDFSPIQRPANDQETDVRTTHFDYHSISGRILKLDLLGHDDPTSIRMLQDITGISPFDIRLDDPATMAIFSSVEPLGVTPEEIGTTIGTLGIPEFGTSFVRQMLIDTRPTTFAELVRISGLSHGTDVWLNNAQDLIKKGSARLSEVISVRDDIMNYLIQKGLEPQKAFWIMEHVRKGKGLTAEEEKYMRENNVPDWYIESCRKIKYMFPKAHAAAYVMMAFRIAYFKVHHPRAFYATYFTTKAGDFDAYQICQGYDHVMRIKSELEEKGNNLTAKEKNVLTILEIVIEAMARGIEFIPVDLYKSDINKFIITEKGLLPPLISLEGLGDSAAQNIAVTREEGEFSSIEDLVKRTSISKTVVEVMQQHGTLAGMPEKNQLSLF